MSNTPKCYLCGRYCREYRIWQPPTPVHKLEPEDPEVVCIICWEEELKENE